MIVWVDYIGADPNTFVASLAVDAEINEGPDSTKFLYPCLSKNAEALIEGYWDGDDGLNADSLAVVDFDGRGPPWLQGVIDTAREAATKVGRG